MDTRVQEQQIIRKATRRLVPFLFLSTSSPSSIA